MGSIGQISVKMAAKIWVILLGAFALGGASFFTASPLFMIGSRAAAITLVFLALAISVVGFMVRRGQEKSQAILANFVEQDVSPSFVTDGDGSITFRNVAAKQRFSDQNVQTLSATLKEVYANPNAVLYRLRMLAEKEGAAREDIVTRRGHVRLTVHMLGEGGFLWRLEEMNGENAANTSDRKNLAMITVGRNNAVLFMNDAARQLIGERIKTLDRILFEMPLKSGKVNRISTEHGVKFCFVSETERAAGRREIYLIPCSSEEMETADGWEFFDELPVALMKLSQDGTVQMSNRLARKLLGNEECDGKKLPDFLEGLGRSITDWLKEAAEGRGLQHAEFLRVSRQDKEVFVQVTLKLVSEGETPILIAVLNDATELKTLEAQFVQSQKMQAIGQLAGGVAHDFNNLLTAISGHCDLLLLRHDQGDLDYNDLTQINQNANRAAALVGQLLAFSRKQTLRPEILDLRDTLSDMTHLLNRLIGEKVTLSLSHDPLLPSIRADKRQLEQVLMNLVVNARDAMQQGGEIKIETESVELTEPLKRDRAVVAPGVYVSLRVSDDGVGIPLDKQRKVFEPFFTTKRTGEGTGLGLSTAYGIIKQSGGYIFLDSEPNVGTSFILMFPVHHNKTEQTIPAASPEILTSNKHEEGVILLVEDEAPVRAFASRALRMRGYTVLEADSAEDALRTLEDSELSVDIFVTDVVMPGMDGPSWVRKALRDRPGVRVVFVSGYAEETFSDTQSQIPNSVFLPKPFSLVELTETVRRQLH